MNITRYKPDTCKCELLFEWDPESSEDNRTHTPVESFTNGRNEVFTTVRCEDHQIEDVNELHNQVVEKENKLKNKVLAHIIKNIPEATVEIENEGKKDKVLKEGILDWKFNKKRELEITTQLTGLDEIKTLGKVKLNG